MAGCGVRTSWASTIDGKSNDLDKRIDTKFHKLLARLPPPPTQQPSREVHLSTHALDQVLLPMPPFAGRPKPDLYIEWEIALNAIFVSHNFSEHTKVKSAISAFTGFAVIWWNEYCRLYPAYIPNTWNDIKLAMRHKFIPSYYTRDMVKKLQNLKQGTHTVTEYYDALETTLLHAFLEESEEDFMDRFWDGLNRDIQEMLIHEKCYSMDCLFRLACKAEQELQRRIGHKTNKRKVQIPRVEMANPSSSMSTTITHVEMVVPSTTMSTTSPLPGAPSSSKGNEHGMDFLPPHENDECFVDLNTSCVELSSNLITPSVFEDYVVDMHVQCVPTNEITTISNAPIKVIIDEPEPCDLVHKYDCDHILEIPTILSSPSAGIDSPIDSVVDTEINIDKLEPFDLIMTPGLDHIKLFRHDELIDKISYDTCLWSIVMDPPMSLSHVKNKIAECTCLKNVYGPYFTFNLIGEYGVDSIFLVHKICITCDDFEVLKENNLLHMFTHFDMTSNYGIEFTPNILLHDSLSKQVCLPLLGWFNDEHCKSLYMNTNFTNMCKPSAPVAMDPLSDANLPPTCFDLTPIYYKHEMTSCCTSMLHRTICANSICHIIFAMPQTLPYAINEIFHVTSLNSFHSAYAIRLNFNLICDYGIDDTCLVHGICICCDDIAKLPLYSSNTLHMPCHDQLDLVSFDTWYDFHMVHNMLYSNMHAMDIHIDVPHTCYTLDPIHVEPNRYHCMMDDVFLYRASNLFPHGISCANLHVHKLGSIKMDDIYIYHVYTLSPLLQKLREIKVGDKYIYNMYTLSLLLATFQVKQSRGWLCCPEGGQSRGRLCFQKREDDEDMATVHGPVTRAHARQLNYQVLSFFAHSSNDHEYMMLPKWDTFILLQNEGPSKDGRDAAWSELKHGEEGVPARKGQIPSLGPDIRPGPDIRRNEGLFCCFASRNPDSTGHLVDRTSGGYRTSVACPSPGVNSVRYEF